MSTSSLESYVSSARCVGCHTDVVEGLPEASGTAMARAASRLGDSGFVREIPGGRFDSGEFKYILHVSTEGLEYSVSRENETALQRLDWVMGSGELGRTFVYQRDGRWFQSRLSEYQVAPKLDLTTGLTVPARAEAGYRKHHPNLPKS